MVAVPPSAERRHRPDDDPWWEESWDFDFAAADGSVAGYVRLALHPAWGVAWYWAALVGEGRRLLTVLVDDAPLPSGGGLDLRAEGLWCDTICETPLEHWTLGLEAFGVVLDDPVEVYGHVAGEVTALGLDVEWEAAGEAVGTDERRYRQPCLVHGEVLVGAERLALEGHGQRAHAWGAAGWGRGWWSVGGRLDDGTAFAAGDPTGEGGGRAPVGWLQRPGGGTEEGPARLDVGLGAGDVPDAARCTVGDLALELVAVHAAPARVDGRRGLISRLPRVLCRATAADGRGGTAWLELNQPL